MANVPGLRSWSKQNFEVNGLNAGHLNSFANALRSSIKKLSNPREAGLLIAEETAEYAGRFVPQDAYTDKDGNKIYGIEVRPTDYGATVSMQSPHKERSKYPDAYFIEYGYGIKGEGNEAVRAGAAPKNWNPAGSPHGGDDHWFYYDQYGGITEQGHAVMSFQDSRTPKGKPGWGGYQGTAAMFKSKRWAMKELRDKNSTLSMKVRDTFGL